MQALWLPGAWQERPLGRSRVSESCAVVKGWLDVGDLPPSGDGNHNLKQAHVDYRGAGGYVVAPPGCIDSDGAEVNSVHENRQLSISCALNFSENAGRPSLQ